jgi:hypothetical protein
MARAELTNAYYDMFSGRYITVDVKTVTKALEDNGYNATGDCRIIEAKLTGFTRDGDAIALVKFPGGDTGNIYLHMDGRTLKGEF